MQGPVSDETGAVEKLSTRSIVVEGREGKSPHEQRKHIAGAVLPKRCPKVQNAKPFELDAQGSVFDNFGAVEKLSTGSIFLATFV